MAADLLCTALSAAIVETVRPSTPSGFRPPSLSPRSCASSRRHQGGASAPLPGGGSWVLPRRPVRLLQPFDQYPHVRAGRVSGFRSPLRVSDREVEMRAAALVDRGIVLAIGRKMFPELGDDLLACRCSPSGSPEPPDREFEVQQEPILEARHRNGGLHDCLASPFSGRSILHPGTDGFDLDISFIVIEDAPDFIQSGIALELAPDLPLDIGSIPERLLQRSDLHVREAKVRAQRIEVFRLGLGSFAEEQNSRSAGSRGRPPTRPAASPPPCRPVSQRIPTPRRQVRRHSAPQGILASAPRWLEDGNPTSGSGLRPRSAVPCRQARPGRGRAHLAEA